MSKVTVTTVTKNGPIVSIKIDGAGVLDLQIEEARGLVEMINSHIGVPKLSGTFVLHMPVQYMVENAKPRDVTVYNLLKEQLTKINQGETAAMILPALTDENGNRMFTLEYVGPQKI